MVYPAKICASPSCVQCGLWQPTGHAINAVHPAAVPSDSSSTEDRSAHANPIADSVAQSRTLAAAATTTTAIRERQAHVRLTRGALEALERALETTDLVRLRDRLCGRAWTRLLSTSPAADGEGARDDWTQVLSPGEQQRVALVRVLFHRPQIAREPFKCIRCTDHMALFTILQDYLPILKY